MMDLQENRNKIFKYSLVSLLLFLIFPPLGVAPVLMLMFMLGYIKGFLYNFLYILIVFFIVFSIETIKAPYNVEGNAFEMLINLLTYIVLVSLISLYCFFIFKSNKNFFIKLILISLPYIVIFAFFIYYEVRSGFSFISFSKSIEIFRDINDFKILAEKIDYILKVVIPRIFIPLSLFIAFIIEQHFAFYLTKNTKISVLKEIKYIKLNKILLYITIFLLYILILLEFIIKIDNSFVMIISYNVVLSFMIIYVIYGYSFLSFYLKNSVFYKLILTPFVIVILIILTLFYGYYLIPAVLIILFILGVVDNSFNIKKI